MIKLLKVTLLGLFALTVAACGSAEKKTQPPEYFFAKQGKPLAAIAPKGIHMPDLSDTLVIPSVNQPLGEYDPTLIEPPNVIGALGDRVDEELAKDEKAK